MRRIDGGKDSCRLDDKRLGRSVLVKKNRRARRMTLRVNPIRRDITLTIPPYANWKQAGEFIERHMEWLQAQEQAMPQLQPFEHEAVIPLEGAPHQLCFVGANDDAAADFLRGETVQRLDGGPDQPPRLQVNGDHRLAPQMLTIWLKQLARNRLNERAAFHAGRLSLRYSKLAVRDQSSRWGSCSSTGALSFSWRLIFAPAGVLDYVAAHEVAHLGEMNHSPRFWKLVAKTRPDYAEARQWLRRNGHDLHRYGAPK